MKTFFAFSIVLFSLVAAQTAHADHCEGSWVGPCTPDFQSCACDPTNGCVGFVTMSCDGYNQSQCQSASCNWVVTPPPPPPPPPPPQYVQLRVCNNSAFNLLYVAVGFNSYGNWMSQGWAHVPKGQCVVALNGADHGVTNPNLYIYATTNTNAPDAGTFWKANDDRVGFCIDGVNGFYSPQNPPAGCGNTFHYQPLSHIVSTNYTWTLN
jgi:hypothetical protein